MGAAYGRSYKCWGYASKQKAALTSVTVETVRVLGVLGILLLAGFVTLKALFIFSVRVEDAADRARFRLKLLPTVTQVLRHVILPNREDSHPW